MYQPSRVFYAFLFAATLTGLSCYSDEPVEQLAGRFTGSYQQAFAGGRNLLMSFATVPARLDSIQRMRETLGSLDTHYLSRDGRQRRAELALLLDREWAHWEPYQIDPSRYNIGGILKKELTGSAGTPAADRIGELSAIMSQAPDYYATARQNLVVDDVSLYRLAAQKQYLGLEFLRNELIDSLNELQVTGAERQAFEQQIERTALALKDYLAFCESVYLNHWDSTYYRQPEESRRKGHAWR